MLMSGGKTLALSDVFGKFLTLQYHQEVVDTQAIPLRPLNPSIAQISVVRE